MLTNIFDNIWMLKLFKQVDLLLKMQLLLLLEVADLNLLYCNQLSSCKVKPFKYLPAGASSHNFTNLLYDAFI